MFSVQVDSFKSCLYAYVMPCFCMDYYMLMGREEGHGCSVPFFGVAQSFSI